jgi:TolA-binding protein
VSANDAMEPPKVIAIYEEDPEETRARRLEYRRSTSPRPRKLGGITRGLLWSAGADADILRMCPYEMPKYVAFGGSIIASSLLAMTSLYLALELAFPALAPTLRLVAAVAWGLSIFNLDRWLVSVETTTVESGPRRPYRRLVSLLPRAVLGIMLAVIVSQPLVLAIFRSETETQLTFQRQQDAAQVTAMIDRRVQETDSQIERLQKELVSLLNGSRAGQTPAQASAATSLQRAIAQLQKERQALQAEATRAEALPTNSGLIAQTRALDTVASQSLATQIAIDGSRILLAIVYLTPVFLLLAGGGRDDTYHMLLRLRMREDVILAERRLGSVLSGFDDAPRTSPASPRPHSLP